MLDTLLKIVTKDSYAYSLENIISCAKYELHWLHLQLLQILQSQNSQWQCKGDSSVFTVVLHKEISNDSAQIVPGRISSQNNFQASQLNMTPAV
jgi:hypothetical protein